MSLKSTLCAATALSLITAGGAFAENLTIATVNNGDMIRMQGLTDDFTAKTGHTVEWVTLEENVLRQRVTTDISTNVNAGLKPHQSPEQQCTIWQILVGVKVRHFSGCRFVHRPARRSAPTEQRSCAGLWSNRGVVFAL